MKKLLTSSFGYPKIGENRQLKKSLEEFWAGKINRDSFFKQTQELNFSRIKKQKDANIDFISSNDFSLYDQMLDMSVMFGIIPDRFKEISDELELYFAMARGNAKSVACEMSKWFDSNYHYIKPEITENFNLKENKPLKNYLSIKNDLKIETIPSMFGPWTFLKLAKNYKKENFESILMDLVPLYRQILKELQDEKVEFVRIEEPAFVFDLTDAEAKVLIKAYNRLTENLNIKIIVQTYYESLSQYERITSELPVYSLGLDFISNTQNFENIKKFGFPKNKKLIAGIVSGRDIWKTDIAKTLNFIEELSKTIGSEELIISNAAPLFHLPVSLEFEKGHLNPQLLELLSFADDRLQELDMLKQIVVKGEKPPAQDFASIIKSFADESVKKKVAGIDENSIGRKEEFVQRKALQDKSLNLPLFPTTTIGSFPQTPQVRKARADFKNGRISKTQYDDFIKSETQKVMKLQEEIDLDILVHGEFERNDMVEYFGEKLKGFAFTKNGWVQSYGSRCVKPPIIFTDVSREEKMTVDNITYAQSLTKKPLKGMLTGPVTILNWSFFRKDIPKKEIAFQLAIALRDEVLDLESAGIKIIQIDEAAFREGLPLKKEKQKDYLDWAVKSFRLTNDKVKPQTQIHSHMCYSEFDEIIGDIYKMDFDVISIEASRSRGEIIEVFEKMKFDRSIGLGVYDIHSPRIPPQDEIFEIVDRSIKVIDKGFFWINPDCGLKTRGYEETIPALKNMVAVAKKARAAAVD
ncbi:MAG: 5-methyltetrahydropteroyltriglutamate--homocysteine S-methyltransferase [Elusimicrobiota bacterium]|jgi:5-methyltetrahydropteroyltriglutamate--homocysteine methyltransferase|nr:5-methyltetrahydropteroyltriglutamate--homocysteine S-methyltransferase [Elusimicrobiota bacterium]